MTAFGQYEIDGTASTMKQRDYKDATDLVVAMNTKQQSQNISVNVSNSIGANDYKEPQIVSQFGPIAGTLLARHDSSPCADRGAML